MIAASVFSPRSEGGEGADQVRALMAPPPVTGKILDPIARREQALQHAEIEPCQDDAAGARLEVARCAWDFARVLPVSREAEYRNLLQRAADLLIDPAVVDIMVCDDRSLKAYVAVEVAPLRAVITEPPQLLDCREGRGHDRKVAYETPTGLMADAAR